MSALSSDYLSSMKSEIARVEEIGDFDEADRLATELLAESRALHEEDPASSAVLFESLRILGDIKRIRGDSQSAEALYAEFLEMNQEQPAPPDLVPEVESGLACVYDFNGREVDSIPFYESAMTLYERSGRVGEAGNLANNLAMVHKGLGNIGEAEQYFLKALELFNSLGERNSESIAAVYNNLGGLYYAAGFQEQAREMHQEALEIRRGIFGESHPEVAQSYANLAAVAHELGQSQRARDYYERALYILETHAETNTEDLLITLENYRELCLATGDEKKAASLKKRQEQL